MSAWFERSAELARQISWRFGMASPVRYAAIEAQDELARMHGELHSQWGKHLDDLRSSVTFEGEGSFVSAFRNWGLKHLVRVFDHAPSSSSFSIPGLTSRIAENGRAQALEPEVAGSAFPNGELATLNATIALQTKHLVLAVKQARERLVRLASTQGAALSAAEARTFRVSRRNLTWIDCVMHRREQVAIGGMTDARTKVLTLLKEMEPTDLYDVAKQELDRAAEAIETEFHENVVAPLTTRLKNRNDDNEFAKNLARGIDLSEKALSDAENTQVRRGEVAGTAERYIDGCGRMIVRKRPMVPFGVNPETRDSEPIATPIEDSGGGTIHRYYLDWTYAAQNTDIHGQCGKISLGAESSNSPLREQLIELNRAFRGIREADLETLDLSFPSIRNALCERKRDDSFNQPSSPQEQIVLRWHRAHPHRQIELRRNTRGFVVIGLACCGEDTKSDQICENIAALLSDLVRTQVRTPFHALMSLQPRDGVVYIPPAFVPPVRIASQVPMETATLGQAVSAILDNGIQADQQDEFGLPSSAIRTLADRYRRVLHENLDALDQIQNAIDVSGFQKE